MAKARKSAADESGKTLPECIALLFAENVNTSKEDGVLSFIRVVDTVMIPLPPSHLKTGDGVQMAGLKLVAMLRTPNPIGDHAIQMICVGPRGHSEPIGLAIVPFDVPAIPGHPIAKNLVSEFTVAWDGDGIYWIELWSDQRRIARTPLNVKVFVPNDPSPPK